MNSPLTLPDHAPTAIVFTGAVILLALFLAKEWLHLGRRGFTLRAILATLAISALAGVALKPEFRQMREAGYAMLLTPGYSHEQQDSLVRNYPGIHQIEYKPGQHVSLPEDATGVFILGFGLEHYDHWLLDGRASTLLTSAGPRGITSLEAGWEATLGEELVIRGEYSGPKPGGRLLLRDSGGHARDSTEFGVEVETQPFELRTKTAAAGLFTYILEEQDSSGSVLRSDPIPVEVRQPHPVRILILNTFPTFETRYLKNYLSDKGMEVVVRSQLTRGAYKFEYFNQEPQPIHGLTAGNLERFDLVIVDSETYRNLGVASRSALLDQMERGGLGLLIQPDDAVFSGTGPGDLFRFNRDGQDELQIDSDPAIRIGKYPYEIVPTFPVEPIRLADGSRIGAYRPVGNGRIVATNLKSTFELVLEGEQEAYQAIWSGLISAGVGSEAAGHWEPVTRMPVKDSPFTFRLYGQGDKPRVRNESDFIIPMIRDPRMAYRWEGTDYPRMEGWNTLRLETDSSEVFSYYASSDADWESLRQRRNLDAMRAVVATDTSGGADLVAYVPVNPIWFFVVFLLSSGWLWLEPRIASR